MFERLHIASRILLAYTVLVILWGAYVRVTGSGAGCADHWPLCNGQWVPRPERIETLIELTHRLTSALAGVGSVVLWFWARRVAPAGHGVRRAASAALVCMLLEGAVGAALVKLELVENDASVARAVVIGFHLANTFALLGAQALMVHFTGGGGPLRVRGSQGALGLLSAVVLTMLVGSSGAVTALGDTLFPAASLSEGMAQDLSPTAHFLVRLRVAHPLIAFGTAAFVAYIALALRQASDDPAVRRWCGVLISLFAIQVGFGLLNLWLLAPAALQILHLLMADAVWLALCALCAKSFAVSSPEQA